jgi:putative ATP-binding cassette transporter
MRTTVVSQGSSLIAPVFPVLLCAPKFLDGSMTLGQVMQAASAFTIVQSAFGWLVDNYPRLADWNAWSADRLANVDRRWSARRPATTSVASPAQTADDAILSLNDLKVTLVTAPPWSTRPKWWSSRGAFAGCGRPGSGKSTLCARSQGCGRGRAALTFIPTVGHAAAAALRAVRLFAPRNRHPGAANDWTGEQIKDALDKVGLRI